MAPAGGRQPLLFYGAACGSSDELQSIHQVMRKIWTDFRDLRKIFSF